MSRKIRYYYDEDSCTFKPEVVTPKVVANRVLRFLGGSSLLAVGMYVIIAFAYDDPKERYLRLENEKLMTSIEHLNAEFTHLDSAINFLHDQDNNLYRSLTNAEKIDDGIWDAGIGGNVSLGGETDPEVLVDARGMVERLNAKIKIQTQSYLKLREDLKTKKEELKHVPAIKPVPGKVVSGYGMRHHPIHNRKKMHWGIDMQASMRTPVHAAGDGTIKLAGISRGGYGRQIEIDHGGFGYKTKYAHLNEILVKRGQKVKRGDIIGYSGNSGLSSGPHLHYEIFKNGKRIDPIDFFYNDVTPEEYVKLREQAAVKNSSLD
ncbi:M23 family metallopeptidase [Pontibacter sp. G13]|uniref:M23 family metallopeptidase n=1 Tax=Pontibacter sp. G13 TaxID=3074898 RepID=UPI00288BE087|nr:M23 family metallopeptidase [Pontibacter sp. G13]WNJ21044.1 M23 family metallopeptidase [Pontibacter sp. G13]